MRLLILLLLVLVSVRALAQPPVAERRVAFVVGIGAYKNVPQLANPVHDARAIGDSLRGLNFEVSEIYDPDFRKLSEALRAFGIKAAQADVAVRLSPSVRAATAVMRVMMHSRREAAARAYRRIPTLSTGWT